MKGIFYGYWKPYSWSSFFLQISWRKYKKTTVSELNFLEHIYNFHMLYLHYLDLRFYEAEYNTYMYI